MASILDHCTDLPDTAFAPGEILLREGDDGGTLFILIDGMVEVSKSGMRIARISGAGALFGEMSVLLSMPISATVKAVEPVRAYRCDDPAHFIAENPAMARHTAELLACRLHAATTYITDLKVQFAAETGHLRIMDKMLDAMLEGQLENLRLRATARSERADARL